MNSLRWWLLIVAALVVGWFFGGRSPQPDNNEWRSEVDSLRRANAALLLTRDSLYASSKAHNDIADSLNSVPKEIYIHHANSATDNAAIDSLGRMFFADPFTVAPE